MHTIGFKLCITWIPILTIREENMWHEYIIKQQREVSKVNWLFNVTINDISVIYVTAHRCAGGLKKLDLRSGSQRHRHFVGFFNVPVLAPTREHPFYTVRHTAPISRLLRSRWGYGGRIFDLTPGPSRGNSRGREIEIETGFY